MEIKFLGDNLTPVEYEALALSIDPASREGESDLFRTKWFDYADMHPAKTTYLFAHFYRLQVFKFIETCIDVRTASERATSAPKDVFTSKHLLSFWNARRVCDAVGCPYDFALNLAQHRAHDRMMRVFPQPNQLCGEDFEMDLRDAWSALVTRSLRYSKGAQFNMKNYSGTLLQKRHIQSLIQQVKNRSIESQPGLIGRLLSEGALSEAFLHGEFSTAVIERAKNNADSLIQ